MRYATSDVGAHQLIIRLVIHWCHLVVALINTRVDIINSGEMSSDDNSLSRVALTGATVSGVISTDEMDTAAERDGYDDDIGTHCGYTSSCKPACLQRFANPKVYLVIISLCSIVQGETPVYHHL